MPAHLLWDPGRPTLLGKEGISAKLTSQEYLQIGSKILKPIKENTGGYQNIDARATQVLLNYRSPLMLLDRYL